MNEEMADHDIKPNLKKTKTRTKNSECYFMSAARNDLKYLK